MHPKEMGWEGINWFCVARDRDKWQANLKMVMNLCVPQNAWKVMRTVLLEVSVCARVCIHVCMVCTVMTLIRK
jgi:hypothetical protein